MGETDFVIGSRVACQNGDCGELRRVVIDPVARALTHLVVAPHHRRNFGRLVPIGLVESVDASSVIHLRCTTADFETLDAAEETEFLPGAPGEWGYPQTDMLSFPYFGLGMGGMGIYEGSRAPRPVITYDKVPIGEVEVRRGEHVEAADGRVGRVKGLVIDPTDHRVTHLLLDEGHLWGKRQVAVPINAISRVAGGVVHLNLTKDEIKDLPSIEVRAS